jgi:hypothetical protein
MMNGHDQADQGHRNGEHTQANAVSGEVQMQLRQQVFKKRFDLPNRKSSKKAAK